MPENRCPFCGYLTAPTGETHRMYSINFDFCSNSDALSRKPHLQLLIFRCENENCGKESVLIAGQNGYIENKAFCIYPENSAIHFPEYVPEQIRRDYEEACAICTRSPKASATLARRCLQGMIRDFWQVTGKKNLSQEIDAIKDKVTAEQWQAIDGIRTIGNIGAHMERDVNRIVDVEPDEAQMLLSLIELLIKHWYIKRHKEQELYRNISEIARRKMEAKSSMPAGHFPPAAPPPATNKK